MFATVTIRSSLITSIGCLLGIILIALAPALLRQSSMKPDRLLLAQTRLIAIEMEEMEDLEELQTEPEPPPPEPEIKPDPPDFEPPEIEPAKIIPPQMTYGAAQTYSTKLSIPTLSGIGLEGINISGATLNRPNGRAAVPGLPKHGPPKTRFNADEVDRQPSPLATMQPVYPYRAKRLGLEGQVKVRFLVDRSGRTGHLKILRAVPSGEFEKAVEKTVLRWKFKPALKDGDPVETWVETTIKFQLNS